MEVMNNTVLTGQIKKETHKGKLIALLMVLTFVGAAVYFSAQPASISNIQSGKVLSLFKTLGFQSITSQTVRKLAHLVLFGTIGAAFTFALSFKFEGFKLFQFGFMLSALTGIIDETHQMFVPGRGPQVKDVMIDSAGAFVGVLILFTIISIYKSRKSQQTC